MEANVFKKRIEKAFLEKEFIKILFQYPSSNFATKKSGVVIDVGEDGFELEDIRDGKVVFSYKFICEIKGEEDNEEYRTI